MKAKLRNLKDKVLKNPADDKKRVFEGLIRNFLSAGFSVVETGQKENYLYRINGK